MQGRRDNKGKKKKIEAVVKGVAVCKGGGKCRQGVASEWCQLSGCVPLSWAYVKVSISMLLVLCHPYRCLVMHVLLLALIEQPNQNEGQSARCMVIRLVFLRNWSLNGEFVANPSLSRPAQLAWQPVPSRLWSVYLSASSSLYF
jgi:hypothetical protein